MYCYLELLFEVGIGVDDLVEQDLDCLPDLDLLGVAHVYVAGLGLLHRHGTIGDLDIEASQRGAFIALFDDADDLAQILVQGIGDHHL